MTPNIDPRFPAKLFPATHLFFLEGPVLTDGVARNISNGHTNMALDELSVYAEDNGIWHPILGEYQWSDVEDYKTLKQLSDELNSANSALRDRQR